MDINKELEEYLLRSLEAEKINFNNDPLCYGDNIINILSCIVELYYKRKDYKKTEEYSLLKIDCLKRLDKLNPSVYTQKVIDEYCRLLDGLNDRNDFERLEKHSLSYIEYLKEDSKESIGKKDLLARNYMILGNLYSRCDKSNPAIDCYITSINIYKEVIKVYSSVEVLKGFARAYLHLGMEYSGYLGEIEIDCNDDERIRNIEECFLASVKLRENIVKMDDDWNHKAELGRMYNDIGVFYYNFHPDNDIKKIRVYYQKSIETLAEIADKDRKGIYPDIAFAYENLGLTYKYGSGDDLTIAKECFLTAIGLFKEIVKMGNTSYNSSLADNYENMISLCQIIGDIDGVEKYSVLLSELNDCIEDE